MTDRVATFDMNVIVDPDKYDGLEKFRNECFFNHTRQDIAESGGSFELPITASRLSAVAGCVNAAIESGAVEKAQKPLYFGAVVDPMQKALVESAKNGITNVTFDFTGVLSRIPQAKEYAAKYLEGRSYLYTFEGDVARVKY